MAKESPQIYVPIDRRQAIAQGVTLPDRVEGAALFADISGFTALTEALARELGPQRGAEQLTIYLNRVYDALISVLHRYGGSTIGFSGDAMTCWFDGDDGHRATASAIAMQAAMGQFANVPNPAGGVISLAVKTAVAVGPARRFLVGDPQIQLIDTLAGATLDHLAETEHHSKKGEVVLDESALKSLAGEVEILSRIKDEDTGQEFGVVASLLRPVMTTPWPDLSESKVNDESARPYLLPPVYQRLQSGLGEFLAELRPAVALFMRFTGLEYDCFECSGEQLNRFIHRVQSILSAYDGSLIQLTIGDKGSYLYAAFGAPLAHEDDAMRAVSAAQKLLALGHDPDFEVTIQIGITRGRMRTGAYGGSGRHTYGVLGDAVNLAARLMQAAQPGQLLVTKAVTQIVEGFLWQDLGQIQVKGKSEQISIYSLVGIRADAQSGLREVHYALPLLGRKKELGELSATLQEVLEGHGKVIGITGEAGLGKSRLVSEVVNLARAQRMACYVGECQSFGTNTGYLVWQPIWRSFFNLNPADPPTRQIEVLKEELLRLDAAAVARLPLLGALLDLPLEENDLTRGLDAKIRKSSLEALLVDCAIAFARDHPLVFVLEDIHWIDPLSLDLLVAISRATADLPLMILTAYRPPGLQDTRTQQFTRLPGFIQVALADFNAEEAEEFIRLKLTKMSESDQDVPQAIIRAVVKRTEGNPFYIEELLNYLHDLAIDLRNEHALEAVDLPTGLQSLILSRIDQLIESQKITLKIASVIGRLFHAAILWGAYPPIGEPEIVRQNLEALERAELTIQDNDPELTYFFKHIVIQEVAYESLPFAMRALLHNQIGEYLEQASDEALQQFVDLLAFHYGRSDNLPKKREYLEKAGNLARQRYNNVAAVDYYQRLLPLLEPEEKGRVLLRLGEVLVVLGRWDEARENFWLALNLAEERNDPSGICKAQVVIGDFHRKQGHYQEAATFLEMARAGFEKMGDAEGVGKVLHSAGTLAAQQGNYPLAQQYYTNSLEIRRQLNDLPRISNLLNNLGIVARQAGEHARARELYLESLAICRELGDTWAVGLSLSNLGNLALDQGDLNEARQRCEEALAMQREVGDKYFIANVLNNLGNVLRAQGEFDRAFQAYRESLSINQILGDGWALAYLLEDVGSLAALQSRPDRALRLVAAASALREAINAPLSPVERARLESHLQSVREVVSTDDQAAFWAEGRILPLAQAVELALNP